MFSAQHKPRVVVVEARRLVETLLVVAVLTGITQATFVVILMTGNTFLAQPKIGTTATRLSKTLNLGSDLKCGFVAVSTRGLTVLADQGVAHGFVIESFSAAAGPSDDVEVASMVIFVALTALTRCTRCVVTATGLDAIIERIVATEA